MAEPRSEEHKIEADLRFVGVFVPPDQRDELAKIAVETHRSSMPSDQLRASPLRFVETEEELLDTLRVFLEVEPIYTDSVTIVRVLNNVTHHLNNMQEELKQDAFSEEAARRNLQKAWQEFNKTALLVEDPGTRQTREEFQELYELAKRNRDIQTRYWTFRHR